MNFYFEMAKVKQAWFRQLVTEALPKFLKVDVSKFEPTDMEAKQSFRFLYMFDGTQYEVVVTSLPHSGCIEFLILSPDENTVCCLADEHMNIWNIPDPSEASFQYALDYWLQTIASPNKNKLFRDLRF